MGTPATDRPGRPTVIFDLGGVLLEHDPALAFATVMPVEDVPGFMLAIDYPAWHHQHDAGRTFAEGLSVLGSTHPQHVEAARALGKSFQTTLPGYVPGTGAVLAELDQAGVRLLGLTNFPDEPFDETYRRFGLLRRLEGVLVSGREGLAKPDPAIFGRLLERWVVDPADAVFVDDRADNCAAAEQVGLTGVIFDCADGLRERLVGLGLLGPRRPAPDRIWHIAEAEHWAEAVRTGRYPWSTRGMTMLEQGYVHCSRTDQVDGVLNGCYSDLARTDLVLLEIHPDRLASPVISEDPSGRRDPRSEFPHIYGPLEPGAVVATHPVPSRQPR